MEFRVVPQFPPGDPRNLPGGPAGNSGRYLVQSVLGVPGVDSVLRVLSLDSLEGDSLVQLPRGATRVSMPVGQHPTTPDVDITLNANRYGRLARADLIVNADGFDTAHALSYNLLAPLLSRLSFDHNVAIDMVAIEITEVLTGSRLIGARMVGRGADLMLQDQAIHSTAETRALLSTFREGVNAESPFLRALSFAKVVEGATHLRNARSSSIAASGGRPSEPAERIPPDVDALAIDGRDEVARQAFNPYLGKKFTTVMENLRPTIRNAIAHLDPRAEHSLVADRWAHFQTVEKATPVLAYVARVLLGHEIEVVQTQAPQLLDDANPLD